MARNTFSVGTLNAATPGISRLAQALAGAGGVRKNAEDQEMGVQSRIAQTMAEAQLRTAQAQQEAAKTGILNRRPDLYNEQVANAAGTDMPTVGAYRSQLRTGQAPLVPMGPPTEEGAMGQGSLVLPDAVKSKLAGALQQFLPLLSNGGDLNPEQLAKAAGIFRESDLSDRIINGGLDRNRVAGAQAAAGGKAIYNTNGDGAVLDQYGGSLDASNPMARATIAERQARAGEAGARAQLVRTQRDMAGKGVIQQTDDGFVLIDPRTGQGVPVTGPDGAQLAGKSKPLKDIPPPVNAKIIEGQQGLTNLDQAIAALHKNPGAVGWTNAIPGAQTVKQLWASPEDIGTRAQVANIGSLVLHDRSGAAVSASEFPRLAPFIPSPSDSEETATRKLMEMKRIAEDELGLYAGTYGPESGYKPSPILQNHTPAQGSPAAAHGQAQPAAQPGAGMFRITHVDGKPHQ